MSKLILLAAAGLALTPAAALANAYAYTEIAVNSATFTVTPAPIALGTFSIFSDTAASYLGAGTSSSNSTIIPGVADAAQSRAGTALSPLENDFTQVLLATPGSRADATITAGMSSGTSASNAESHVLTGAANFANASSGNRVSLAFTLSIGTVVSVAVDFSRIFDLRTDSAGEVASGVANIEATLTRVSNSTRVPVVISGFNPSSSNSTSDGDDFFLADGGIIVFTFSPIRARGEYTLNVAERTVTDVRSAVVDAPAPAMIGLFGLGLAAIGMLRRRR